VRDRPVVISLWRYSARDQNAAAENIPRYSFRDGQQTGIDDGLHDTLVAQKALQVSIRL
jgi:hypothetical protein